MVLTTGPDAAKNVFRWHSENEGIRNWGKMAWLVSAFWFIGLVCAVFYMLISACALALIQRSKLEGDKAGERNNKVCFYGGWTVDVLAAILLLFVWGCSPLSSIAALLPLQSAVVVVASYLVLHRRIRRAEGIGMCALLGFIICTVVFGSRAVIKDPSYFRLSDVLQFWKDPWTLIIVTIMIIGFFGMISVLALDARKEEQQSGFGLCVPVLSGFLCSWCFFWYKFTAMQPLSIRWWDNGIMYFSDFCIGFVLTLVFGFGSWYVSRRCGRMDDCISRMTFLVSTVFFLLVEAAVFFGDWKGVAAWKIMLFHLSAVCCLVAACWLHHIFYPGTPDGDERENISNTVEHDLLKHHMISVIAACVGLFFLYVLFFTCCIGVMVWQTNYLSHYDEKSQVGLPSLGVLALGHNMGQIIEEFVRHYRAEGVTQFVLIDWHRSNDKWVDVARRLNVTVVQNYNETEFEQTNGVSYEGQVGQYNAYLDMVKTDWFLLVDGDEFAYARGEHPTIPHYLATLSDHVSAVSIPWKVYGGWSNYYQPRSIINGFQRRSSNGRFSRAFKEIIRTSHVKKAMHHGSIVQHYRIHPNGKAVFPIFTAQGGFGNYRMQHESEMCRIGIASIQFLL